jgi:hypothetical protein
MRKLINEWKRTLCYDDPYMNKNINKWVYTT